MGHPWDHSALLTYTFYTFLTSSKSRVWQKTVLPIRIAIKKLRDSASQTSKSSYFDPFRPRFSFFFMKMQEGHPIDTNIWTHPIHHKLYLRNTKICWGSHFSYFFNMDSGSISYVLSFCLTKNGWTFFKSGTKMIHKNAF